jgi:hypothetical protein
VTTVTEENTEPTETTEESAESATPPSADGDSTETTGKAKEKAKRTPKTYKERLDAALEKDNIVHKAFVAMVKRETDRDIDLDSVIAAFSLYNDWRASEAEDYKAAKAEAEAARPAKTPKAVKQPKTLAEADSESAKLRERLAEIDRIKAQLLVAQTGEEAEASETESTENAAEATETGNDTPPF